MTKPVGLIAGTVFYYKDYFAQAERKVIETEYGQATVLLANKWVYIARHGLDGEPYIHAYKVDHLANIAALAELGVQDVIGINSCGSLRPSLEPGSVVLPSDYICFNNLVSVYNDQRAHITPRLSDLVRSKLSQAAKDAGIFLVEGGVYWQTPGPRLETRAEIQLLSHYADMVGMTLANEASVAQEMGLDYASLCSVDNHAHGLSPKSLTLEEITDNSTANADRILKILEKYMEV